MTLPMLLHLLGSMVLLTLVRTTSADDPLTFIGWAILLGGLAWAIAKVKGSSRGLTLGCMLVGILAMGLMVCGGMGMIAGLGLDETSAHQAEVVLAGLWPLLWFAATVSLLTVERVRAANPMVLPRSRARQAAWAGLSTALGLACLLPLNYLAHEHNERWDHSYFKTAQPGSSTLALVENLTDPVQAYLFFPHTSDVTEEIRTYFDQLDAARFEVSFVEHALEGDLAKELKVRCGAGGKQVGCVPCGYTACGGRAAGVGGGV